MTTLLEPPPAPSAGQPYAAPPRSGAPKSPKPPKRVPPTLHVRPPLSPVQTGVRMGLALLAVLLLGLVGYVTVFSRMVHLIDQDRLDQVYRAQLAAGTAPVSEGTYDGVLLTDGAPVARITIPQIGIDETVVEGTTSGAMMAGPAHRRDTPLPGQVGTSVVMGRAAAFGGPFARIQELQPGATFTVLTGQGEQTFQVIGVRYAGDPAPSPISAGQSRLILESARGPAFLPSGVVRVDAQLMSTPQARGARSTTLATLPAAAKEMEGDLSHVWALVFALQALIAVEILAVWAARRVGRREAWIVCVPLGLLAALAVADQVTRLLPNLM